MRSLVVFGGGGHAKVVVDAIRAGGVWTVTGVLDPTAREPVLGAPVLGGDDRAPILLAQGVEAAFVALGDNAMRIKVAAELRRLGFHLPSVIHPRAVVAPSASIGEGVLVCAGAVINPEARIGDFAIINTRACVEHDGHIGAGAHIAPGVVLAGAVTIGDGAFLGAGSCVTPGVSVGARAVVGAGACVVRDIGADTVAYGVPARPQRPANVSETL